MDNLHLKQNPNAAQHLLLSLSMQKALFILQLPIMELKSFLEEELSSNPLVEIDETGCEGKSSASKTYTATSATYENEQETTTLFSHYMHQVRLIFSTKKDLWIAEQLLGSVNEKGLLEEIPEVLIEFFSANCINTVLHEIQMMDPPGICARSDKDCLLIQLSALGKKDSLAYDIISCFYKELLEQKFSILEKKYKLPAKEIQQLIKKDLSLLDPFPGLRFRDKPAQAIIPDIIFEEIDGAWSISVNDKPLPSFMISSHYHPHYRSLSHDERRFFSKHINAAKWIQTSLTKRKKTLQHLARFLLTKHKDFFEKAEGMLQPLTLSEVAAELCLSESTIARAVSDKYLSCPRGVFALKYFFSSKASHNENALSSNSAKELLQKIVRGESKDKPLSDKEIATAMTRMGFCCARRTITKYRKSLKIAPASKRKI